MLHIHTSTDYQQLAQAYKDVDKGIIKPLLTPHPVIVPNMAIGRWLAQYCAASQGIAANLERLLPAEFIWRLKRQLQPDLSPQSDFSESVLLFSIMDVFCDEQYCTKYPRLNNYLAASDLSNRYHLANRMAQLFENYQLYRPDWLTSWEASQLLDLGDDEPWQQALWLRLTQASIQTPRNELDKQLVQTLLQYPEQFSLPSTLCLFGVSQAPPAFYSVIEAVSQHIDVHVFTWLPANGAEQSVLPHWLTSGEQVKALLADCESVDHNLPSQKKRHNQLAQLQARLLGDLVDPPDNSIAIEADNSVVLACCYSPMREVEALHDYLLARFQADTSLNPGDVLVAVSDINTYTPFIRAVFDEAENPIPYSVNESFAGKESALLSGLLALMEIPLWRFTREEIEVLLHNRLIRRCFSLSQADLEQIHSWLDDASVRWGIDGDHRAEFGLPNNSEHTWRAGLDRLLLGFALPCALAETLPLYGENQVLPVDQVDGRNSELLSRFISFVELLIVWRERFKQSYSISEWQPLLHTLLVEFFDVDELEEGIKQQLLKVISRLGESAQQAGSATLFDVKTIRAMLEDGYAHIGRSGRLSGAVTFTGMSTLAGLPYAMVCLLGMDYDKWPKRYSQPGFDLLAKGDMRVGDRSDSDLQRFQTLQLLASAKQSVYISYTGRDIKSGEQRPESVLIAELINAAEQADITIPTYRQGMHPYSLSNFQPGLLQSHSPHWLATARSIGSGDRQFSQLFSQQQGHEQQDQEQRQVEIPSTIAMDELKGFFSNPQRSFLKSSLGIYLSNQTLEWENSEPFALDNFTDSQVRGAILPMLLSKKSSDDDSFILNRAGGLLPHGDYGKRLHDYELNSVKSLLGFAPLGFAQNSIELPYQKISLKIETDRGIKGISPLPNSVHQIELGGIINHVFPEGIQQFLVGDLYDYQKVTFWLEHLFLCCCRPPGVKPVTHVIYRDKNQVVKEWFLRSPENPENLLATWIEAYLYGLNAPLPFFSKTSSAYAKSYQKHQDSDKAFAAAKALWREGFNSSGEGGKDHNQFLYRDEEPLDECFGAWAELLLIPLIEHIQTERPEILQVNDLASLEEANNG